MKYGGGGGRGGQAGNAVILKGNQEACQSRDFSEMMAGSRFLCQYTGSQHPSMIFWFSNIIMYHVKHNSGILRVRLHRIRNK